MKLWQRVNNLTGNSTSSKNLVEYLNMASKLLTASLPEKFLWSITTESEVHGFSSAGANTIGDGSSLAYDKILAVYRLDSGKKRVAAEAPDKNIHIFDEANSLLGATEMFPKFYKLSGKVYIKPDPDYNNQSSNIVDNEETNNETYTDINGTSVIVAPAAGDKGVVVYAAPPKVSENDDAWLLVEFENVAIMYSASMDMLYQSKSNRDSANTSLTAVSTALTNYLSGYPDHDINSISLPDLTWNAIGTLTSLVTEETAFSSDAFSMSGLSLPSPASYIPQDSPVLDFTNVDDAFTKSEKLIDDGAAAGTTTNYDAISLLAAEDIELIQGNISIVQSEIQRARGNVEKERSKIEEFSAKLNRGNQEFQAEIAKWGAQVQKETARVDNELKQLRSDIEKRSFKSKEIKDKYASELDKVKTQLQIDQQTNTQAVQKFAQDIQQKVQAYQMDLKKRDRYMGEANMHLQKVQSHLAVAGQQTQLSNTYYGWAMNELKAITGGAAAPVQQQQAQRKEETKSDQ